MAKKSGLGKGFEDIIFDIESSYNEAFKSNTSIVEEIDISSISPNPYQPRKHFNTEALNELSDSIKRHGLIQPIIVIKKDGGYTLIAGERRLRATKLLGESKIRAIVADLGSQNLRELALIENIQRENLNPIELANSYKELIDEYQITQEALSNIIHKSRTQITNTMRLLSLSDETRALIADEKLTQGHAKTIVGLSKDDEKMVVDTIIGQKLTVRETENLIKKLKETKKPKRQILNEDIEYESEILRLGGILEKFGLKTKVKNRKITIEFSDIVQIRTLLENLK
ncbi:Nucleoid occlusion protein [Campylobacter majalis]|uniref:Nucleoid occlusion protein n=1 Tax=Campylobacter majalis TaxID=2790656 RepID=A0ABN7K584_9BACT|nr:ParB/RepB/Spo0J family partition protein [Campylobacter majalis]CAD7287600.1 Nucleoid occlusion protein [Campylobacter majalis]